MTSAEELARLRRRLGGLRAQAARAPLDRDGLAALTALATQLEALTATVVREEAALTESRGLALEDTRALLGDVRASARDAAREVVLQLRRAGKVRTAARTYLAQVKRAAGDPDLGLLLAGFAMLLEEHGLRAARHVHAIHGALPDGPLDRQARAFLDENLAELNIDWAALPERG